MAPSATPKTTAAARGKLSPVKLDPLQSSITPTKPEKVIIKSKNNVLEQTSPNTQLASKFDAMSLSSPGSSPTKRVYHPSPTKENRAQNNGATAVEQFQITLRPPPDDDFGGMSSGGGGHGGMSEQAKKSLRSINALRGLTIDEIEIINKPNVKRLATVTQLCTYPLTPSFHFCLF